VIGSDFTGLELATELAGRYRVVLIERADVIAPSLGVGPRETIARALKDLGVEVRLVQRFRETEHIARIPQAWKIPISAQARGTKPLRHPLISDVAWY